MCECGCGEFVPFAQFPGPEGIVYALGIYPPCDNGCDTPAGVVLSRFRAGSRDAKHILRGVRQVQFQGDLDLAWAERFIAVLHPRDLLAVARAGMEKDSDEWFGAEESLSASNFREAMRRTQAGEFWWKDTPTPEAPR